MAADDRGPEILAVLFTFVALVVPSTLLRCYSMGWILRRFFSEDWLTLASLILYIPFTVFSVLSVKHGLGKHNVDVAPIDRPIAIMYRWIAELLYIVLSLTTKWIVGLFLLRICPKERWRRVTIWTMLSATTVFYVFYLGVAIASCQPISYEWTRYNPVPAEGKCNSTYFATIPAYLAGFINILVDWVLPILPITLIWRTKMHPRTKGSVIALLALGSVASVATIVRVFHAKGILDNPDYLYNFTDLGIWSYVEVGMALTASSLATLKPLLRSLNIFFTTSVHDSGWSAGNKHSAAAASAQRSQRSTARSNAADLELRVQVLDDSESLCPIRERDAERDAASPSPVIMDPPRREKPLPHRPGDHDSSGSDMDLIIPQPGSVRFAEHHGSRAGSAGPQEEDPSMGIELAQPNYPRWVHHVALQHKSSWLTNSS